VGLDEIRATLEAKGTDPNCPVCGLDAAWDHILPGFGKMALDTGFYPALEVIPLICHECGYIRLHHYETLMGQPPPQMPQDDDPLRDATS